MSDTGNGPITYSTIEQDQNRDDRSSFLAIEADLWNSIMENPEDQERHNTYFSFITRNNLLKEASRRYGAMVGAKDDYSIDARRQFREYQKNIVNLMFITGPRDTTPQKRSSLEYLMFLALPVMIVFGFVMIFYESTRPFGVGLFFLGIGVLAFLITMKIKSASEKIKKENQFY